MKKLTIKQIRKEIIGEKEKAFDKKHDEWTNARNNLRYEQEEILKELERGKKVYTYTLTEHRRIWERLIPDEYFEALKNLATERGQRILKWFDKEVGK